MCRGTLYSLACECVASHHLIEPCQSRSQGIPQSACAIYCQGPKIQIDLDRHTDGVFFFPANKILKLEVQARRHLCNFFFFCIKTAEKFKTNDATTVIFNSSWMNSNTRDVSFHPQHDTVIQLICLINLLKWEREINCSNAIYVSQWDILNKWSRSGTHTLYFYSLVLKIYPHFC